VPPTACLIRGQFQRAKSRAEGGFFQPSKTAPYYLRQPFTQTIPRECQRGQKQPAHACRCLQAGRSGESPRRCDIPGSLSSFRLKHGLTIPAQAFRRRSAAAWLPGAGSGHSGQTGRAAASVLEEGAGVIRSAGQSGPLICRCLFQGWRIALLRC